MRLSSLSPSTPVGGSAAAAAASVDAFATATWTSGYVGDVPYTLGFHRELSPSFLNYVCLLGRVASVADSARMRYCDLGCGRGYGTTLLAASNPDVEFVGIDFNPSHVAEARRFATRSGIGNATFLEMGFGDAARSADPRLAQFEVVALHGVYAWVAPMIREDIHEFLRAKLAPGGIAFVSYNALPGWAGMIPVQRLLLEVANRSSGDSIARLEQGVELLRLLVEKSDGLHAARGSGAKERLLKMAHQDKNYLAHEYLNDAWQPLFVTDALAALGEARLSYVGSATIASNRTELCVPKELRDTVRSASDLAMRELVQDCIIGREFRRDVYVKGPQALSPGEQTKRLLNQSFALTSNGTDAPDKLRVPVGEMRPRKETLQAIWDRMQEGPVTGAELLGAATAAGEKEEFAWLLIEILVHCGHLEPCRHMAAADSSPSHRLNDLVVELARMSDDYQFLASPLLGSAIRSTFPERISASLLKEMPDADDATIAARAFDCVAESGQRFMKKGEPVERTPDSVQELAKFVARFREHGLPRWRALKIVGQPMPRLP